MTRKEAVGVIKDFVAYGEHVNAFVYKGSTSIPIDALNMAIKALEQEPIIHCKNCKHWQEWENGTGACHKSDMFWVGSDYDDYCSFAERKESDE